MLLEVGGSAFQAPTDDNIDAGKDPLVMRGYILAWAHRLDDHNNHLQAASVVGRGGSSVASPSAPVSSTTTTTTTTRQVPAGVTIGKRRYELRLLDYAAGKQSHVCRGIWSPELHNQCDMVDTGSILAGFMLETNIGPQ